MPKQYPLGEGDFVIASAYLNIDNPAARPSAITVAVQNAMKMLRRIRGVTRLPKGARQLKERLTAYAVEQRDALPTTPETRVYRRAVERHPLCHDWFRVRATGTSRTYVCNVCDVDIDSEAAGYTRTKHVERALDAHYEIHLREEIEST